ncbi:type IV pilus assembly protein PilM [Salinisphaera sp. Q1T1-3]|uniref:type IV pilus assembly protein PilM n=1 Tax=Salinisphaera sp. Q1T1-3 TaxID=2321229 RepID=UPI000E771D9C|nr:type IV pilus assembly protein PilM [Salinisphaera sp. Q1T1-3]RJS94304.1 type IV pilus assembly protein PilM [Salinisphaera sp. Q1T1-3]
MGRLTELLRRPPPSLVGVDISARRIRLLEFERAGAGLRVAAYASAALDNDAAQDFSIDSVEPVARGIRTALEHSGTRTRQAAIAVSGPDVISKTILMPAALDDMELEQQIHLDIEHYVSHPIAEVHVDFQILEPDPKDPDYNRVLLVACRRETVELRMAALEMAGLKVRIVDVEEYALQNACSLLAPVAADDGVTDGESVAVFDVGALDTRLTVQQGPRSRYARNIAFGGLHVARELVRQYRLDDIDQLHAKLRVGELRAEDIAAEITGFAQELAAHIERALDFYLSASAESHERITRVVVTGGVARYPGLEALLAEQLEWSTTLGNPLAGMPATAPAYRNHVETEAPALMVAAGLALRGVHSA